MSLKVTLEDNIPWLIRVLFKGDKYGLDMCLTHEDEEPLVEFYDRRYPFEKDPQGEVLGQFVSRYCLSTMLEHDCSYGLNLQGDVPNWSISPDGMKQVHTFLTSDYSLLAYSKKFQNNSR